MITDNTGKAILSARKKIQQAESLLRCGTKKNIHWFASIRLSIMDKRGMLVPDLEFSQKMPMAARMDGEHWVTFQDSVDGKMSGKDFKKRIAEYAHENGYTMVEVSEITKDMNLVVLEGGRIWSNSR